MGWSEFVGTCAVVPNLAGPRQESHDQKEDDDARNYHQLTILSMAVGILSPLASNWILKKLLAFSTQSLATYLGSKVVFKTSIDGILSKPIYDLFNNCKNI